MNFRSRLGEVRWTHVKNEPASILPQGINSAEDWNKWQTWRVNVDYLEELTGYDFLSNVPKEIQDIIEADNSRIPLAASLLGDTEITDSLGPEVFPTSGNFWIGDDFPVGHDSFTSLSGPRNIFQDHISEISSVKNSTFKGNFNNIGSFQISLTQIRAVKNDSFQITTPEDSTSKISLSKVSISKVGSFQTGIAHDNITQIGFPENSSIKINPSAFGLCQVSPTQVSPIEVSITAISKNQIGCTEVNANEVNTSQITTPQINPTKVSFPSSVPLQQILNSYPHLYTSALTNTFKDNPLNLFDPTFNINFQITDLPTGQLAEAQITQFDSFGRPNGGTILIDADANGIGWFIDPTPWENSEFTTF